MDSNPELSEGTCGKVVWKDETRVPQGWQALRGAGLATPVGDPD